MVFASPTAIGSLSSLLLLAAACAPQEPVIGVLDAKADPQARRVLLVVNRASADSLQVGRYYAAKRRVPRSNVLLVETVASDNIPEADFERLKGAIRTRVKASKSRIDFIVLTKGVPIRIKDNSGYSTDAHIAAMDLPVRAIQGRTDREFRQALSPYFNKREPFSSKKFGFYLVTRLDGYTAADAKRLVDNALAAKREQGPFLLDAAPAKSTEGYAPLHRGLVIAAAMLAKEGFVARLDATAEFVLPDGPLAGYASWGSNDPKFSLETYQKLRFKPGAIAETFVSTSARTFRRTEGGQSLVADLIEQGVTGVKGYVSEPYTFALARPEILFERYTSGFNLAESFYMASPLLKWKDVVVGDPLCSPYANR